MSSKRKEGHPSKSTLMTKIVKVQISDINLAIEKKEPNGFNNLDQFLFQVSPSTDKSDADDHDKKDEENNIATSVASVASVAAQWPGFNLNGAPPGGHLAGLLAQNGNGGTAVS